MSKTRIRMMAAMAVAGTAVSYAAAAGEGPDTMTITAVVRDFKAAEQSGGHPDFQAFSGTTTVGLVASDLGPDGVPVVASLRGSTIQTEFTDSQGRPINPAMYDASRGDKAGVLVAGGTGNGLKSADSFSQWYRTVPGVNIATAVPLTLTRVEGTDRFVFDSATDAPYASIGGFFPIDEALFGNYSSGHNYHFTTEVRTRFVYRRGSGQTFKFTGDDDVWVFVNGKLVIDLGGLHARKEQFIDLDRLGWLSNGACTLDVFHAERRTTQSNFRMETTIRFRDAHLPNSSAMYD